MKLKGTTIAISLALAALTGLSVRYKLDVLARPETGVLLNTLSLALFVMFCEESPEYSGPKATEKHAILKRFSNRQVGAALLGVMILNYMYGGWACVREARGPDLLHHIAEALPLPRSTTLP